MIFDKIKELEEEFEMGEVPAAEEFEGEYYVTAPVFPWVSLKPLKHRKDVGIGGEGENVLLDNTRFGSFQLEEDGDTLLINYDNDDNPRIMRGVRDRLRRLDDGRIIGKLYYKILGKEVFIMFFEMVKKEDDDY